MICISVTGQRMPDLLKDYASAQSLAEIVEVRPDDITDFSLDELLRHKKRRLILTVRIRQHPDQAKRISLIKQALGNDKIDHIDIDIKDLPYLIPLPQRHYPQIIISYHNYISTPRNLADIYDEIAHNLHLNPDIIKIVTYAKNLSDNLAIFGLSKYCPDKPLIAFCMGQNGQISRILYRKFGFHMTYASLKPAKETAPGQISFKELKYLYRADKLTADTKVYGLLGYPLSHSASPRYFNERFGQARKDSVYLAFPLVTLSAFDELTRALNIRGYSVTAPHKAAVIRHLDELDREAKQIGAVNTVYRKSGKLIGANTDWYGALQSIGMPGYQRFRRRFYPAGNDCAVILGAGGAARAIAWALRKHRIPVTIVSRNNHSGKRAATGLGCSYARWDELKYIRNISLLVNATPIGMFPNIRSSPAGPGIFNRRMTVFDAVYNPEETLFLKRARRKGAKVISGLKMFIAQAQKQLDYFR